MPRRYVLAHQWLWFDTKTAPNKTFAFVLLYFLVLMFSFSVQKADSRYIHAFLASGCGSGSGDGSNNGDNGPPPCVAHCNWDNDNCPQDCDTSECLAGKNWHMILVGSIDVCHQQIHCVCLTPLLSFFVFDVIFISKRRKSNDGCLLRKRLH